MKNKKSATKGIYSVRIERPLYYVIKVEGIEAHSEEEAQKIALDRVTILDEKQWKASPMRNSMHWGEVVLSKYSTICTFTAEQREEFNKKYPQNKRGNDNV